jgi:hypothetical protein
VGDLVEGYGVETHQLEVISKRLEGFVDANVGLVVHGAEVHRVADNFIVSLCNLYRDWLSKDLSDIRIIECVEHTGRDMSAAVRAQILVPL